MSAAGVDDAAMTGAQPTGEAALRAEIAAIPGVARLYPASNVVARVASAVGATVAGTEPGGGDIVLAEASIAIRIGVGADRAAAEVCRAVYATARDWAAASGMHEPSIRVTVAGIE
ncbi:hypothetical protein IT072_17080 [Leifsonia sp. ZF2019]|uniref:hypothetical protein n=1 Tax=Leifsonia sp. ZF2019 TaxID=2781978 RepID=UPI001CBBF429|nr:hypothetical protein [Leifsonia sp. ZF2019]UAJ78909.1 hypothetical protein IT072_17080 [Leifsonia sp. ZF2019]